MKLWMDLRDRLTGLDLRVEQSTLLLAVRRGFTLIIPFLLIGSFALIVTSLPVPAYQRLMTTVFGLHWKLLGNLIFNGSVGILSILLTLAVSYSHANETGRDGHAGVNPMHAAMVALSSLLVLSGFVGEGLSISSLGATGLLSAILVALAASRLFAGLSRMRRLHVHYYPDGGGADFNDAIVGMFPALLTIALFAGLGSVLHACFGVQGPQELLSGALLKLFRAPGPTVWNALLFVLLVHCFWMLGIHGSMLLEPVARGIFVPGLAANQQLVAAHLPPASIFTKTFFDTFVLMGGCGSTLCLVIAIFAVAGHGNLRRQARFSLVPVLFNVNELIVFGIPIVLNPVYLIPFVGTPLLLTLVAGAATASGLVPYTTHPVEWTTPVLLGGFLATGSVSGGVLQVFNLALGTLCYIPFVRIAEHRGRARMQRTIHRIGEAIEAAPRSRVRTALLSRRDEIGMAARVLASDLEQDLDRGRLALFYQPQFDDHGAIIGVEALLRWKHVQYGYIAPPVAVSLAEEAHCFEKLDHWILVTACAQMRTLLDRGLTGITMSINTTAGQMEGHQLVPNLQAAIAANRLPPDCLKLEITEQDALAATDTTFSHLAAIRAMGVKLAMDDFGMGHTSILYLKEYIFDTVKIDGSLVTGLMTNPACGEIIASIVTLGRSLGFEIIAEYVETEAQRDQLKRLGCCQYQGYLYCKALPSAELAEFIETW
jgi:lactose/cellobiose-specific phosphotransferase system IIC component